MNDQKLIGVDLGGTTVKFAILTQGGEIQQRWSIDTNILDEGSHILPDIVTSINEHLILSVLAWVRPDRWTVRRAQSSVLTT